MFVARIFLCIYPKTAAIGIVENSTFIENLCLIQTAVLPKGFRSLRNKIRSVQHIKFVPATASYLQTEIHAKHKTYLLV